MEDSVKTGLRLQLALLKNFYLTTYKEKQIESYGLLTGFSGVILLQSLFFEATGNKTFKREINSNIDLLIKNIEFGTVNSPTFCDGLAGIGWLFDYLNEKEIIRIKTDEFFEDMDLALNAEAEKMIAESNYDLMHGYLGIGLYFLRRNKFLPVEKLIYSLENSCDKIENEIVWKRFDKFRLKKDIYDFGLAHGNASILYFLGKCYKKNILSAKCLSLIKGLINFYFANFQDIENSRSFFPTLKSVETYKKMDSSGYSRLGWCYGDLGILHTLLMVSFWLNDEDLKIKIISFLEKLTYRLEEKDTSIVDPYFCHGSAGVGYIYSHINQMTGKKIFQQASEYWINKTLIYLNQNNNIAYKKNDNEKSEHSKTDDLLNGIGGISLLLISDKYKNTDYSWNELFFLS
jgi:hypothetical protein